MTTPEAIRKSIIGFSHLDGARVENADAILSRLEEKVKALPPKPAAPAPAPEAPKPADPAAGELTPEEEAAALAAREAEDAARAEAENHG